MKIADFDLAKRVLVIAEIGNNHEGNFALAEEMIGLAAGAGVGAVKFQTIVPERLVAASETARIAQLKKFQFSYEQFSKLAAFASKQGVMFLSTPFDIESAKFLDTIVPAFKIASGDNNFFPLLETVARTGKPILLSSGMSEIEDVKAAKSCIERVWSDSNTEIENLAVLHCVASYPTAPSDANLAAITQLRDLGLTVGYSDHTIGCDAAVIAAALGARVIEKHFTIDKNHSEFRDHQLSADPKDMKELVERVNATTVLLGDGEKRILETERETASRARRSIVARNDLKQGSVLRIEDLDWLRPGTGLTPGHEKDIVGKRLLRDVKSGEQMKIDDVGI